MTWHCPCCVRELEERERMATTKTIRQKALDETVDDYHQVTIVNGAICGVFLMSSYYQDSHRLAYIVAAILVYAMNLASKRRLKRTLKVYCK